MYLNRVQNLYSSLLGVGRGLGGLLDGAHEFPLCEPVLHLEHLLVRDEAEENRLDAHPEDLREHAAHPISQ